jgi:hypothetical protein
VVQPLPLRLPGPVLPHPCSWGSGPPGPDRGRPRRPSMPTGWCCAGSPAQGGPATAAGASRPRTPEAKCRGRPLPGRILGRRPLGRYPSNSS